MVNVFLLKSKNPESNRQDSAFKPLGGSIKISPKMRSILSKKGYELDQKTRYHSKNNDFRIYIDLNNNHFINKVLYSEKLEYFQKELLREMREEMKTSTKNIKKIFSLNEDQPISIQPHFTEPDFSVLNCNDYVHHIVFDIKIQDNKLLNDILKNNNRIK